MAGPVGPITPVAVSGKAAPGTQQTFTQFIYPTVDNAGNVVFLGSLSPTGVPLPQAFEERGVWSAAASGEVRLVVRENGPAPEMAEGTRFLSTGFRISTGADGQVVLNPSWYNGLRAGPGPFPVPVVQGSAVYSWTPGDGLRLLAHEGGPLPGATASAVAGPLTNARARADGTTIFNATITGPGISAANDEALFVANPAGDVRVVAREGAQAPGMSPGVTFTSGPTAVVFPAGQDILINGEVAGAGQEQPYRATLVGTPGTFRPLNVPSDATSFRTGGVDRLVFNAGPGRNEIWSGSESEGFRRVVRLGDSAPVDDPPQHFRMFQFDSSDPYPPPNASGQIAFAADVGRPNTAGSESGGLWTGTSAQDLALVVIRDDNVPGSPGWRFVGHGFGPVRVTDDGKVLFLARVFAGEGQIADAGLFVYDRQSGVVPVALSGQRVELSPGDLRQFGSIYDFAVSPGGHVAFAARITDGEWGIFRTTVPEPSGAAAAVGGVALAALRRRRQTLRV